MDKKNFRCIVCDAVGKWENVDQFKLKPKGMCICTSCGFVSFPEKYQTEEEIKEYYRTKYRSIPQVANLYSGERKLHYHHFMLKPLFDQWKEAGLERPVVGEIGSALGMFLHWLREQVPGADVHGTELTTGFRKVAYYHFGIRLEEDFDYTKKYDLITSYHVLEHQWNADEMLKKYAACLNDNGVFYLSCPIWFRDLNNSATGGFDIDYYWHEDHINAWGEEHLEYVIAKAGLEIVHKNTEIYGNTYILKKSTKPVTQPKWDVSAYRTFVANAYLVWINIQENKPDQAIAVHRNCPAAWIHFYELNRNVLHKDKEAFNQFLKKSEEACPNSGDMLVFIADVLSRYERYNEAIDKFHLALNKKPNAPSILMGIAACYRGLANKEVDTKKRLQYIKKGLDALLFARETSMELKDKATSWMMHDLCQLDLSKGDNNETSNLSNSVLN